MKIEYFRAGQVLFEEGEASDFACRLVSGEADVTKTFGGEEVILGTAKAGEFVGEMGVIENLPRSATVRAVGALAVEIYPANAFLQRVSGDGALALQLLIRLSERLKTVNRAFAEVLTIATSEPAPAPQASPQALPPLQLQAASAQLADAMPKDGLDIERFPFIVGRKPADEGAFPVAPADLMLADKRPFRLSRAHFAIDAADGGYVVRDLASSLGTEVGGRGLGAMFAADEVRLAPGENMVVAGGRGSPYRFRLILNA